MRKTHDSSSLGTSILRTTQRAPTTTLPSQYIPRSDSHHSTAPHSTLSSAQPIGQPSSLKTEDESMSPLIRPPLPLEPPLPGKRRRQGAGSADVDIKPRKSIKLARKECTVCSDDVATNRFPKLPHVGALKHEHNTCLTCWDRHLRAEIDNGKKYDQVSCPQCDQLLQESEVRALARKSTYSE